MWLGRLESEHDNARAALSWLLEGRDPGLGLRLAAALWKFWDGRGYLSEGSAWLREALAKGGDAAGADAKAAALHGLGVIVGYLGDLERAETYQEGALALYGQLGSRAGVADALCSLGWLAIWRGDAGRAARLLEEGLAAARESENQRSAGAAINGLAVVAFDAKEPEHARRLWEDVLALRREQRSDHGVAQVLINMGFADIATGNHERSTGSLEEALALGRKLSRGELLAGSLLCLGLVEVLKGKPERARSMLVESLDIDMAQESKADIAEDLEAFATTAGVLGQHARAARLWGAAEALREATGSAWGLSERMVYEPHREIARIRLGDAAWEKALADGKAMSLEEAYKYALSDEEPTTPAPKQPSSVGQPSANLTRREREVAQLVAQGFTNRQIASELSISEHTAATHVRKVLKKLGLRSRSELTTWMTERRLRTPGSD